MAGTKQGESGWYQAGQKVYFLEITEDGEWRKQKGPMDVVEWRRIQAGIRPGSSEMGSRPSSKE